MPGILLNAYRIRKDEMRSLAVNFNSLMQALGGSQSMRSFEERFRELQG